MYFPSKHEQPASYSLMVTNDLERFRFITCGKRAIGSLPSKELIAVYEPRVWLAIMFGTKIISVLISLTSGSKSIIQYV